MFFLKLLSLLPFSILYRISDGLYFLIRFLIGYRKKIILTNLRNSFPEKSEKELSKIAAQFYLNLTDLIVETVKVLSLSEKDLRKRVKFTNPELPQKIVNEGKSCIVLAGHLCNWEWLLSACMVNYGYPVDAVYKPLNNKFSDNLMLKIRSKFGAYPLPMKDTMREQIRKKNIPHVLAMVADQTPMKHEIQFWTTFLNQDTPFYVGADKISKMLNMSVFFTGMRRTKRGFYEIYFEEIHLSGDGNEFEAIEKYAKILEAEIRKQPSNWLWSHRRWKHQR